MWKEVLDARSGKTYFRNLITNKFLWHRPSASESKEHSDDTALTCFNNALEVASSIPTTLHTLSTLTHMPTPLPSLNHRPGIQLFPLS